MFGEHPEGGLGEMPGDGDRCAAMPFGGLQTRVEIAHMTVLGSAQVGGANGGFHEGPLQIEIDESGAAGMMSLAAGGEHARDQPAVTGQLFGTGKREISPISRAITGPRISPMPGAVCSRLTMGWGAMVWRIFSSICCTRTPNSSKAMSCCCSMSAV